MASIKELKIKITSLKSTGKITKAMKMIAATKLRKAQLAVDNSKPYDASLKRILNNVLLSMDIENPLSKVREDVKKVHILIFTSDRGLCGPFNASILKETNKFVLEKQSEGKEVKISYAGKRGYDYLNKRFTLGKYYEQAIKLGSYDQAKEICDDLLKYFKVGEDDEVYLAYNYFKSAISQIPTLEKLFPIAPVEVANSQNTADFIFEPKAEDIVEKMIMQTVRFTVYSSLLNSLASEHAARMTAMDNASKNAGELIDKYTLQMNRARQAAITTELTEIVSGAESLKG